MAYVVCIVPISPIRKDASHPSEMVNQLLFGEIAELIEETKSFSKIRAIYDGYEGWCQTSQLALLAEKEPVQKNEIITAEWVSQILINNLPMNIPMGSSLSLLPNGNGKIGKFLFIYSGLSIETGKVVITAEKIKEVCLRFLNTPYLWGGKSVFGIDCSGFVQQVYRYFNQKLPRDAYQQALEGEVGGFLQEAKCGDLAFFDNDEGRINHVGILLNADTIIHASGKVRIDKMDSMGIVNMETGERTHKLRIVKRIVSYG